MDFDSILFAKYLEGGGTHLELFFDQTVSTWDGKAGNNFYCTDYISISKSPDKVVVEYDGTKYNCTKEFDEEFGSYYYGAEYDAQNDTLDFSKYPFRAWFSDEDETLISLMAPDDQTHTFKIYEVKSGGGSSVEVESLSVTANGTYTAEEGKAYSPVTVNVQGGNGYGGDGTWARPLDMPKLDDMDISGGDVVYLTYDATEVEGFCDISVKRSSGDIVVDIGHIENGLFVVENTDTYTSNTMYKKFFGSPNGTYKVIRIRGLITELGFGRNNWTTYDGIYRFSGLQGIIEVYGKLPHLASFTSYGVGRIQAVHLGNAPLTSCVSMFYNDNHLESVDAQNWDLSNCSTLQYAFAYTYSLEHLDVSGWNTGNVTNCQGTFLNSAVEVLDISNWDMSLVSNTTQFMQGTKQLAITVPASLDNISANAFNSADRQVLEYHFKATTPPTLANTNALSGIRSQAKIYVPSASLTAYQTASNWSNYSTYMVGE